MEGEWPSYTRNTDGILDEFIALSDSDSSGIERFAARWGPLHLCQHFRPYCHPPTAQDQRSVGPTLPCRPTRAEPVSAWHRLAANYRAILEMAVRFHKREGGTSDLWEKVFQLQEGDSLSQWWNPQFPLGMEKYMLGLVVSRLMQENGVALEFSWARSKPDIMLAPGFLPAILACQLAFAVAGAPALATCMNCGRPYTPARKPRADQKHYCQTCGPKASKKHSARLRRSKS